MEDSNSFLRTIPQSTNVILGMVVKMWEKTNPEAIKAMYVWHENNEEFLFKSKQEQMEYMERQGLLKRGDNNKRRIEQQIMKLKTDGKLPVK